MYFNEPTLAHNRQSPWLTLLFTLGLYILWVGQMYNIMYSSLWYLAGYFHCPKNLYFCLSIPSYHSNTHTLATTDPSVVCIVLSFPECDIVWIIQYVGFSDWFLSLTNVLVHSISFRGLIAHFLFSTWIYSIVWMAIPQCIHSSSERCLWLLPSFGGCK